MVRSPNDLPPGTSSAELVDESDPGAGCEDSEDPILLEFVERWEGEADEGARAAMTEDYCRRYPHLAGPIRDWLDVRGDFGRLILVDARDAPDPAQLGPYKVVRLLARGGMGSVYEAGDDRLPRRLAVKTIRSGGGSSSGELERFQAECRALARLHHTNIIPIYHAGEEDGLLYFAMPLIDGPNLDDLRSTMCRPCAAEGSSKEHATTWKELIDRASIASSRRRAISRLTLRRGRSATTTLRGPATSTPAAPEPRMPVTAEYMRRVTEIVAVAAEALHSAHEVGVIHFDIKPSNILIEPIEQRAADSEASLRTPSGRAWFRRRLAQAASRLRRPLSAKRPATGSPFRVHPWVIDFGLVSPAERGRDEAHPWPIGLDGGTRGKGTEGFMAPEMLSGVAEKPDPEEAPPPGPYTDVWSLGVTLYLLLTLRMPFDSRSAVVDRDVRPKRPREHNPELPRELEAVVLKALSKPVSDRYPTASAFAEDLRRWLAGIPTIAGRANLWRRAMMWARRRPAAALAAAMTAACTIAAVLGAVQAVRASRHEAAAALAENRAARAEVDGARAEARAARAEARVAEQDAQAKQRELDLLALPRLRAPIRVAGWAEQAWAKTRELSAGRPDPDGRFQGEFSAALEGLDVRPVKSFDRDVEMLAFDRTGSKLLMGWVDRTTRDRPVTRLGLGDVNGQGPLVERSFDGSGKIGFGRDGTPMLLIPDAADPSRLRRYDAVSGAEQLPACLSPSKEPSVLTASTISRHGARMAGIVWPLRRRVGEKPAPEQGPVPPEVVGDTATLVVWDAGTGQVVRSWQEKLERTSDVALSPDGTLLATWDDSGQSKEVSVWSVEAGTPAGRFASDRNSVTSVAFGPDPSWSHEGHPAWLLAVGESGGRITVWDLHARTAVKSIARGSVHDVKALDFSPDGTLLASGGRGSLMLWAVSTGECLLQVPAGSYQLAVAFSPDGRRVAVGRNRAFDLQGGVQVYEVEDGRGRRTLRGLGQRVEKVAVSHGHRLAVLSNDWEIGVFDRSTGSLLGIVDAPIADFADNAALAISADGNRLLCSAGAKASLWDVDGRKLLRRWDLPPALTEAAGFRPDGRLHLVRQETRGRVLPPDSRANRKDHPRVCRLYELIEKGDPRLIAEIPDFDWYVEHIAMPPDAGHFAVQGTSTASGKPTRLIQVYDGATGARIGSIPTSIPPGNTATHMRFDPSGKALMVMTHPDGDEPREVFEIPSLEKLPGRKDPAALGPGASRWLSIYESFPGGPEVLVLRGRDRPTPLARILGVGRGSGSDALQFTPDGNHIVWGNEDGTVTVCDLDELQRRLAGVGLGW